VAIPFGVLPSTAEARGPQFPSLTNAAYFSSTLCLQYPLQRPHTKYTSLVRIVYPVRSHARVKQPARRQSSSPLQRMRLIAMIGMMAYRSIFVPVALEKKTVPSLRILQISLRITSEILFSFFEKPQSFAPTFARYKNQPTVGLPTELSIAPWINFLPLENRPSPAILAIQQ